MNAARRGREESRELHGAPGVEPPGSLREGVVVGMRLRRVLQDRLHLVRCQLRIGLQHERDSTAHDRSGHADRKSTRLNSSHSQISYAVFCLKKKKKKKKNIKNTE